jgi:hypothetical protein
MKKKSMWMVSVAAFFLMASGMFCAVSAEDDDDDRGGKERKHHHEKGEQRHHKDHGGGAVSPAPEANPLYQEKCGSCHLAYPPCLLPSGSWKKMMGELETHFGEPLTIDSASVTLISEYLAQNAADHSSDERSGKIMKDLGGKTPACITEIPYIIKKHSGLPPSIFKTEKVGAFSNCKACHAGAEKGEFDDDTVVLPQ